MGSFISNVGSDEEAAKQVDACGGVDLLVSCLIERKDEIDTLIKLISAFRSLSNSDALRPLILKKKVPVIAVPIALDNQDNKQLQEVVCGLLMNISSEDNLSEILIEAKTVIFTKNVLDAFGSEVGIVSPLFGFLNNVASEELYLTELLKLPGFFSSFEIAFSEVLGNEEASGRACGFLTNVGLLPQGLEEITEDTCKYITQTLENYPQSETTTLKALSACVNITASQEHRRILIDQGIEDSLERVFNTKKLELIIKAASVSINLYNDKDSVDQCKQSFATSLTRNLETHKTQKKFTKRALTIISLICKNNALKESLASQNVIKLCVEIGKSNDKPAFKIKALGALVVFADGSDDTQNRLINDGGLDFVYHQIHLQIQLRLQEL